MSKKTNKTNHVLNLLSAGVKEEAEDKKTGREPAEATKAEKEPADTKKVSGVAVVRQGKDGIAETIKDALEQELEEKKQEEQEKEQIRKKEAEAGGTAEDAEEKKEIPEKIEEEEFIIVNVMERLVAERAQAYMKQFQTCMCARCRADVTALSLTGLPAKYVVVNKNAVSPLMNFYMVKYAGRITVEVTKACMAVQANPHHKKDK
ncbi:late competence development ComFB family protein [Mediterraneibacter sp. NSJ-55]|uniref:Late competence development ComFB family protein n=1 Tax=Mediterraneibacter hominis TaxID=2763054 RepID=A0A923LJC4_9FIRM|nr:late competence development ComFB family protein [Mediterraneibacter hominis]MBC5689363.1 late competence development ComFB family protein [Mediterraneibacter hominis]